MFKRLKTRPEISSSSMSDIAFLLIIFFMLTSVFAMDYALSYRILVTGVGLEATPYKLLLKETGDVYYRHTKVGWPQIRDIGLTWKSSNSSAVPVLEVEPNVPYRNVIMVTDYLKQAGIERVIFTKANTQLSRSH